VPAPRLALTAVAGPEPMPSGKEMKQVAPAPPECDYTWTGFYFGGNAGYGWEVPIQTSIRSRMPPLSLILRPKA